MSEYKNKSGETAEARQITIDNVIEIADWMSENSVTWRTGVDGVELLYMPYSTPGMNEVTTRGYSFVQARLGAWVVMAEDSIHMYFDDNTFYKDYTLVADGGGSSAEHSCNEHGILWTTMYTVTQNDGSEWQVCSAQCLADLADVLRHQEETNV